MSTSKPPSYEELKRRLEAAESALKAIREGRVDTILGERETLVVRLAEAEAREAHLKQVLLAIRNVNQLIVAEDDPRHLIERACVNLTETMGYHNAWIALLGGEPARGLGLPEAGPVAAAAAAGFDGGIETLRERLEYGEFPDCMARAMKSEEALVVGDPAADCPDCPLHGQYGGRAGLVRRLDFDGVTYGILTASVPAAYARDAEEHDLFNEVAGDLAFALYKIAVARKLEENRQHLGLVIEGSGVGTWEWNVQTNETLFNEQWAAMLGYTIEELTPYDYATWERLVHPADLERARRALADCIEGGTNDYNCEFRMKHKDGSWVWILDRGRVMIRDGTGKALSMFGTHTDITEIKQTEEAIKRQHAMLARTEALTHMGSWEWDIASDHVNWSNELFRIFGRDPGTEAPSFAQHPEIYLPEDIQRLRDAVERCVSEGTPYELELRAIRSDGEIRHCVARGQAETDQTGRVVRLAGSLQDITERKQNEEKLRAAEETYRNVFLNAQVGMFRTDIKTGMILDANDAVARFTGYRDREEMLAAPFRIAERYVNPGDRDKMAALLRADGEVTDFEAPFRRNDGSTILMRFSARLVPDKGWIEGVSVDVTRERQAEAALNREHAMLARTEAVAHVGSWEWEAEGDKVTWSEELFRIFGLEPMEEAPPFAEHQAFYVPKDRARLVKAVDECLRNGVPYDLEVRVTRSDGQLRHCVVRGIPEHGADGSVNRLYGSLHDITEIKRAEERIAMLGRMLDSAPAGISIHDTDGRFVFANAENVALHGYDSLDEFLMVNLHELDVPESEALLAERFRKIAEEGEARFEVAHYREDGSTFPLEVLAKQIEWEDRPAILSIATDITERKRAEEALQNILTRFNELAANVPVGVYVLWLRANGHLEFEYVSDRWCEIHQLKREDVLSDISTVNNLVHPDDQDDFVLRNQESFRNRIPFAWEGRFLIGEGTIRWLRIESTPSVCDNGDTRWFGVTSDITARKQAEEKLSNEREQLLTIFNSIDEVIYISDPITHELLYANDYFKKLLPSEPIGAKCYKVIQNLDAPCPFCTNDIILKQNPEPYTWAFYNENLDRHYAIVDRIIRWSDGRDVRFEIAIDVTERKQAEKALRESESRVRTKLNALLDPDGDIGTLNLTDVVDCDEIQSLMDDFHALTDIGVGIIDLEGNVLVGTGWQEVCTEFHRVHPETAKNCIESDTLLTSGVEPGMFKVYKCKNNMLDMVTPIMIGEQHLGNLFLGQFFFEDEEPDIATFRKQARRYGFDEDIYLKAYRAIPRWSRETVDQVMTFYCNLIGMISRISYAHIKLARTSETLRQSEQRFRSFVENANDMVYALSPEGVFTYMSPNWLDFMGEPAEQAIGKSFEPYVHPEDVHLCRAFLEKTLTTGEKQSSVEYRVRHKDGSLRWHVSNGSPVRDETGTVTGYVGIGRDVTEAKQAEEALVRQQRSINLNNRIATVFLTSSRNEVFADVLDVLLKALDSRFGYFGYIDEAGDLVCPSLTRDVWDQCQVAEKSVVFPRSGWGGLWGRSLKKKQTLIANENLRIPEGHVALENALATPIVHRDNLIGQFVVANKAGGYDNDDRDLLKSVAAQTAPILFAIQEEARQKNAHEKLEEQLRQAQKMEAVGRLAGGVAHDFNNMLGIIIGHADMILEEMDPSQPFHADLTQIRKAGERSADLTRQLLAFARKQTVAPKVIDLNKTVEHMLKMLHRLIGEDIDMAWIPGDKLWPVKIDPGQIDQILANLCVNARDAIADVGKVTIETGNTVFDDDYCSVHAGFVPGEYAMLAVSDNGCGMDSETLAHLFEPFFTTKELGKGTGLGLATVYGVVKQNNGFINVYSEPGQGTVFKVYLPRHSAKAVWFSEKRQDKPSERGQGIILLVEDDQAILDLTTRMLEREGYTVVAAGTPGEAIRLAKEHAGDIHLLMSDVVMPEMNGRDLAKNILSLYPHMKCLFMSGYTANVIAHQGVLDEGVNFLQKPFSKSDLAAKVREVLDKARDDNQR